MKCHNGNLSPLLLNERSQSEMATSYKIPTIGHPGKGKIIKA